MTIYLDAGTSTLEIVPYIKALSGMTVVTERLRDCPDSPNAAGHANGGELTM